MTSAASTTSSSDSATPLVAAADGSALGNPGPAGWAWYVDEDTWHAGGWPHGTNNMGELKAVLDLVESTAGEPERELHILCDSQYVINCITRWMPGWKKQGWRKKDKKPVLNRDLLEALDAALAGRRYRFEWVKGHAGHPLNEAADDRARAAATAYQAGRAPETGPGYAGTGKGGPGASATPGDSPSRSQETMDRPVTGPDETPTDQNAPVDLDAAALSDEQVRTAVLAREESLTDPAVHRDPQALGELLADGLSWVTVRGRLADRDTALAHPEQAFRVEAAAETLRFSRPSPDQAVLVTRVRLSRGTAVRSSLWSRSAAGRWSLALRQDTPWS